MKAVLNQILKGDQPASQIFRYKAPADFNVLWKACLSDQQTPTPQGPIIIVWDSTPSDESIHPIRCENVLSPIDWAVAYVTKFKDEKHWPNILILDLQPDSNRSAPLYRQFLQMRTELFPWLKVLAAPNISLTKILNFIKPPATEEKQSEETKPSTNREKKRDDKREQIAAHESLLRSARLNLTEGSTEGEVSRHAIANIIGPVILLGEEQPKNEFRGGSFYIANGEIAEPSRRGGGANHRRALWSVIKLTGQGDTSLNGNAATTTDTPTSRRDSPEGKAASITPPKGSKFRVTLIDDQWHHGWYDWIKSALPSDTVFNVCPDPEFLLAKLSESTSDDCDRRFRLELTPPRDKGKTATEVQSMESRINERFADVLVLDLRLFAGERESEQKLFRQLMSFCRKFEEAPDNPIVTSDKLPADFHPVRRRAWSGFTTDELRSVEEWLNGNGRLADYQLCLSLLPRLLALTDMSLPIMIFSSTGQRAATRHFAQYGNIITAFDKPRFFAKGEIPTADATMARFCEAMFAAAAMSNSRELIAGMIIPCADASRAKGMDEVGGSAQSSADQVLDPKFCHVELYLDEARSTEESTFRLAGLAIGYKDEGDAISLHQAMEIADIVWVGRNAIPKRGKECDPSQSKTTEEIWNQFTAKLTPLLGDRPIMPVVLFRPLRATGLTTDILNPEGLDNILVALLKLCLEIFLFDFLPTLFPPKGATFSVFMARRRRAISFATCPEAETAARILTEKWGIPDARAERNNEEQVWQCIYQSLDDDSVHPLVGEVCALRQTAPAVQITMALAKSLTPGVGTATPGFEYRHVHFIADYIAHFAKLGPDKPNFGRAKDWFDDENIVRLGEIAEVYDDDLLWSLDACRRIEANDFVGALLQFSLVRNRGGSLARLAQKRINQALVEITGEDWNLFVNLLADQASLAAKRAATPVHRWDPAYWPRRSITHPHRKLQPYGKALAATVKFTDNRGTVVEFAEGGKPLKGFCDRNDFPYVLKAGSQITIFKTFRNGKARRGKGGADRAYFVWIYEHKSESVMSSVEQAAIEADSTTDDSVAKASAPDGDPSVQTEEELLEPNQVLIAGLPGETTDADIRSLLGRYTITRSIERLRVKADAVSYRVTLPTSNGAEKLAHMLNGKPHKEAALSVIAGF